MHTFQVVYVSAEPALRSRRHGGYFFSRQEVDEQLDYPPRYIASCYQTKTGGQFYDRFPAYVGPARQVLCQIYADERERRTIDRQYNTPHVECILQAIRRRRRPAEQRGHSG